jgi:hypothetical protein
MGLNGELWNRPFKLVLSQICSIDKRHFLELFVQGAQQINHCFDRTKKYFQVGMSEVVQFVFVTILL